MILVGSQRGGAKNLALHLMKDEIERVWVANASAGKAEGYHPACTTMTAKKMEEGWGYGLCRLSKTLAARGVKPLSFLKT